MGVTEIPTVPVTACTVATVAELPAVRVLLRSFLDHHPGASWHVLLVDSDATTGIPVPDGASVEFVHPAALGIDRDELARLRTAFAAPDLAAVLRPRLLRRLLGSASTSGPVLYLAPSVLVLAPITDLVLSGLVERSVVLLPRVLRPLPDDGLRPDPADLHEAGVFDDGLIAVNRGAEPFLRSWADRAVHGRPGLPDDTAVLVEPFVLRDPGLGLSVWNAGQRGLRADEHGAIRVEGAPLRTIHFDGFDPARPWLFSARVADRPRVLLSEHRLLARLCASYVSALTAGADPSGPGPVEQRIGPCTPPASLRADYRSAWLAAERTGVEPPPAWTDDPAEFLKWAFGAVDGKPNSTRWADAAWRDDADLRRRFPDPFGADLTAFRTWSTEVGVPAGRLPSDAVPSAHRGEARLTDQFGVSVLGTGRVATLLRDAAAASGLPVSAEPDYPIVLCCDPAEEPAGQRYRIAVVSTSDVPAGAFDEIWTLSTATAAVVSEAVDVPVHPIGLPVRDEGERDEATLAAARGKLGWPDDSGVLFVAFADHRREHADTAIDVISVFRSAFDTNIDNDIEAGLTVLVEGAEHDQAATERLRLAAAVDDRITLVEDPDPAERETWLDAADCVVSLHHADEPGTDLTMFTLVGPVARGIPLIATEAGAAAELLADGALMLPLGPDGRTPDRTAAVEALRLVGVDPEPVTRLGQLGRVALLRSHGITGSGDELRTRVEHSYHSWRARRVAELPDDQRDPLRPLRSARHVLLREPDVGGGHKIPMAPALRKAVLRVLNHYDAHLRTTLGTLVDGVERTAEELAKRQDAISAMAGTVSIDGLVDQVDRLSERLDRSTDRVTSLDDGVLRARADLAAQAQRITELEDAVVGEASKRAKQVETLANRLDRLTAALDKTLDRIDGLEERMVASLQSGDTRTEDGLRAAQHALRTTDALRRVVLREHESRADPETLPDTPSSLVLCDAGLLRLPAEDGVMLPLLSSNGVWEPELSALIDSLVEPDKIFVDVGAYVGYHTLRVLSRLGTSGAVLAVEPNPTAATLLRHNMSVNVSEATLARLTVLPSAAWDTQGTLRAEPAMTGGFTVRPLPEDAESTPQTVPSVRLDREIDEIEALRGMPLSVVKVDAPGTSHRALGGLVRRLRRDRPHVFCSFSVALTSEVGDDPATVLREFDTWGYDIVFLGEAEPSTPQQVLDRATGQRSTTLWLRPRGR